MLILRKIKLTFIWASLLVLASTFLIGLAPVQNTSAASIEESRDRRYVAGLVQCLMRLDDVFGEYITESNLDDWLGYDYAVVGLDMEVPDGVVTCGTALNESAKILANKQTASEAQVWLQNNIFPTTNGPDPTFQDFQGLRVRTSDTQGPAQIFMDVTLIPYVNRIPVDARELAERMLILADFCYGYNDRDFNPSEFSNRSGTIFATEISISQNQAADFVSLDKNNDGLTLGGLGGNNTYLADHELRFNMRTGGNSSTGGWDGPYVSNFLPIGADNINLVNEFSTRDDGTGRGSIQDCNIIKDLEAQYGIFDFYVLNADSKLTFDGKTAQDILDSSTQDVDLNLSEGGNVASCEGADALGWVMCPFISGVLNLSNKIFDNFIVPFLKVDPINTSSGPVYSIWSSFRTVGNILLVFGLLFIVFGQSIGGGLVDAYTAKKAMPRIFIAAILINLSIYIVAFMVDMGNILGAGIGEMITAPLFASGNGAYKLDGIVGLVGLVGLILVVTIPILIIYLLIKTSGPSGDKALFKSLLKAVMYFGFFVAIPIILLIASIFFTLIIRLGTILLLCVISPVALALFVMPATEKYAKKWLDFLIKSIIVYPIVVAIFAIAMLLGTLLSSSVNGIDFVGLSSGLSDLTDTSSLLAAGLTGGISIVPDALTSFFDLDLTGILFSLASLLVMFVPLAMIPFSFKLAGGVMGSLINASVKGRGGLDKVLRGDKHNPHGRFVKATDRASHHREHLRRSVIDRMQNTNISERGPDGRYIEGETPSTGKLVGAYFKSRRSRRSAHPDTPPPPRNAAPVVTNNVSSDLADTFDKASQPKGNEATPGFVSDLDDLPGAPTNTPTPPTPPTSPNTNPPQLNTTKPWKSNTAPSSPLPRQNTPTAPAQPSQASVAQNQFGKQQAGGLNTSSDGYITPGGIVVPDTDTVQRINEEKNKQE